MIGITEERPHGGWPETLSGPGTVDPGVSGWYCLAGHALTEVLPVQRLLLGGLVLCASTLCFACDPVPTLTLTGPKLPSRGPRCDFAILSVPPAEGFVELGTIVNAFESSAEGFKNEGG